jgi:phosphatidylserine/phosphatidylglycerophosphate/cardiolipin synthase-like enzyme
VVDTLKSAKATVLVQAYSFTSEPIAQALVEAHKRGVDVEVILDKEPADGGRCSRQAVAGGRDPGAD